MSLRRIPRQTRAAFSIRRRRRGGGNEAFTLIEVMFALTFFAIGLLSMAQLIPLASRQLQASRGQTSSINLAQSTLEDLTNRNYSDPDLTAGSHYFTAGRRTVSYTVQDDVPVPGNKRIDLVVTWDESGRTRNVSYSTVLSR